MAFLRLCAKCDYKHFRERLWLLVFQPILAYKGFEKSHKHRNQDEGSRHLQKIQRLLPISRCKDRLLMPSLWFLHNDWTWSSRYWNTRMVDLLSKISWIHLHPIHLSGCPCSSLRTQRKILSNTSSCSKGTYHNNLHVQKNTGSIRYALSAYVEGHIWLITYACMATSTISSANWL